MNNEQRLNKLLKEQKELLEELDKETKGLNNNLDKIIEICDVFIKLNSVRQDEAYDVDKIQDVF